MNYVFYYFMIWMITTYIVLIVLVFNALYKTHSRIADGLGIMILASFSGLVMTGLLFVLDRLS